MKQIGDPLLSHIDENHDQTIEVNISDKGMFIYIYIHFNL